MSRESMRFSEFTKVAPTLNVSFFLSYLGWHTLPLHASAEACLATPGKGLV